jgi:hypothetical protein
MRELFGWIDLLESACSIFSKRSRRDYPMVLLLILFAVSCLSTYALWFRHKT